MKIHKILLICFIGCFAIWFINNIFPFMSNHSIFSINISFGGMNLIPKNIADLFLCFSIILFLWFIRELKIHSEKQDQEYQCKKRIKDLENNHKKIIRIYKNDLEYLREIIKRNKI